MRLREHYHLAALLRTCLLVVYETPVLNLRDWSSRRSFAYHRCIGLLQNWRNQRLVFAGTPVEVLLAHIYHFSRLLPCRLRNFQSLLTCVVGTLLLPDLDTAAFVHIRQNWGEETVDTSSRLVPLGSRIELFQCLRSTIGTRIWLFSSMALWSVFRRDETLSS